MRILLIDDNVECLIDVRTSLEYYHQCDMYTVPEEAIAAYQKNRYDVVITDMNMPGTDGIGVLKQVRELNPEAKVIITTAYQDVETVNAAIYHCASAFLGKPVGFIDLIETLRKMEQENA